MDFKILLKKIKKRALSADEQKAFELWYADSKEHREFYANLKDKELRGSDNIDVDGAWIELEERMSIRPERKGLRKYYYIAAASIIILLLSSFFFHYQNKVVVPDFTPDVVEAGTDKAILKLSDGALIDLEKSASYSNEEVKATGEELIYDKEDKVFEKEIKYNELTVPKGGQYKVTLADGTKVWLNSDTKLKYPVRFREDMPREVELLYGEAYFEVTSSEDNHNNNFWVLSKNQRIEVLGTKFNVSNYREEGNAKTTLVEGKVFLSYENMKEGIILNPGFQARYDRELEEWNMQKVNTEFVVAWKDGYFKFRDTSLEDIMRTISRWYNIKVDFKNDTLKSTRFNGVFRKDQEIDNLLEIIKDNTTIDYSIEDNQLEIY